MTDASTLSLLTAFGGGLASFLSPCVAPLVPGYLALISGAAGASPSSPGERYRVFTTSALFVAGFSLVFVALGASVSAFGDLFFADYRQDVARVSGALMILMGVVLLWGFRFPFLMAERKLHYEPRSFTNSETLLLGMAFGFGWTPCFGPILASILAYTSTVEGVRQGTALLIAYSLGLGLPFLVAGLSMSRFRRLLSFFTRHMRVVVTFSGITLIAVGTLFVTGEVFRIAIVSQRFLDRMPLLAGG